jgi:DNA-directed RNA polymerase subunit M/transcription elongation factor TFIIS
MHNIQQTKNKLNHEKLMTIARFANPEEAYVIAARLQSAGIRPSVIDEFSINLSWALGEVKVKVSESDAADATRILSSDHQDIDITSSREKCPKCNASNIQRQMFSFSPLYSIFLLMLLISLVSSFQPLAGRFISPTSNLKCQTCGYQWKNG